ncbi:hypothetical protein [Spongiivirga citrea]|uniref:Uncharacterized protein n=1 Tax=Spongiivirga citrea TaxID=1481457 RepID=A0A6M0CGH9_9FLAO|nr:hypothetical protein [Spongiivirga citrea]NER16023.1 hypothetical protein [Spongiivirga citrea]
MKEEQNKEMEALSKKLFKEVELQSPDSNFEFKVMEQISSLPIPGSMAKYKAPFSKWVIPITIITLIGSILLILLFGTGNQYDIMSKLPSFNFEAISSPLQRIPKTVIFAMLALAVLLFAQIPILKVTFKNRWH